MLCSMWVHKAWEMSCFCRWKNIILFKISLLCCFLYWLLQTTVVWWGKDCLPWGETVGDLGSAESSSNIKQKPPRSRHWIGRTVQSQTDMLYQASTGDAGIKQGTKAAGGCIWNRMSSSARTCELGKSQCTFKHRRWCQELSAAGEASNTQL